MDDLPNDVIYNIFLYVDDVTFYFKVSDLWQQLELSSNKTYTTLSTGARSGKKWLVDFNPRKTQLVLFAQSMNSGAVDVKIDGSVP